MRCLGGGGGGVPEPSAPGSRAGTGTRGCGPATSGGPPILFILKMHKALAGLEDQALRGWGLGVGGMGRGSCSWARPSGPGLWAVGGHAPTGAAAVALPGLPGPAGGGWLEPLACLR